MRKIKIAYIGGGSKQWARVFMSDLAVAKDLEGEIALYDIDLVAAKRNALIGEFINKDKNTNSIFKYKVYEDVDKCLIGSDFVIMSILPGTFEEMRSDVHTPEKYGIYQSVGDTTGPGGVLRAMRTVPIYEFYGKKIKKNCPNAWVINLTNPMSICVKTLYDVFPNIKCFGCCHEVFHAQDFLCLVLKKTKKINVTRKDIYTDASGINHFTWINSAYYNDIDLLKLIPEFKEKYFEKGYYEHEEKGGRFAFKTDPFAYGNKVKMELFMKHNCLPAAGDRHIVEFLPHDLFLKDKNTVSKYAFNLTTVDFRINQMNERIQETIDYSSGKKKFNVSKSDEEVVDLMQAIMGFKTIVSNVNMPNIGQVDGLPLGSIVETNCVFSNNHIRPVVSKKLPTQVLNIVKKNCINVDDCYQGIKERNLDKIFESFKNQVLLKGLNKSKCFELFKTMCLNTRKYLDPYFDLNKYFKI